MITTADPVCRLANDHLSIHRADKQLYISTLQVAEYDSFDPDPSLRSLIHVKPKKLQPEKPPARRDS